MHASALLLRNHHILSIECLRKGGFECKDKTLGLDRSPFPGTDQNSPIQLYRACAVPILAHTTLPRGWPTDAAAQQSPKVVKQGDRSPFPSFPRKRESSKNNMLWKSPYKRKSNDHLHKDSLRLPSCEQTCRHSLHRRYIRSQATRLVAQERHGGGFHETLPCSQACLVRGPSLHGKRHPWRKDPEEME